MKVIKLLIIASFLNISIYAASMKATMQVSVAGAVICKVYAEEVGGDVEAFSEMYFTILQGAEKMGYTNDFQSFQSDVSISKDMLKKQLLKTYNTKLNIYNNWCIKLYNGYQNGIKKAYQ